MPEPIKQVNRRFLTLIFFSLCLLSATAAAQNEEVKVPAEVKPFVEKGMIPIALETADLNADGRKDLILVLSKPTPADGTYDEAGDAERPTLVLVRGTDNTLSLAARNDRVAYCKNCGGVLGDPFQGVQIRGTRFTVMNYGGSADRWEASFTFDYSRRDHTWQLVRVEENSFNAFTPNRVHKSIYTPPKNFGLIDFADFDPGNFKGKGKK